VRRNHGENRKRRHENHISPPSASPYSMETRPHSLRRPWFAHARQAQVSRRTHLMSAGSGVSTSSRRTDHFASRGGSTGGFGISSMPRARSRERRNSPGG
jgi:hypothetical protein